MNGEISNLVDINNERIVNRDKIYFPLVQRLAPTPTSTRQSILSRYSSNQVQSNGNAAFASNISVVSEIEAVLQNRFFALQKSDQACYVPSTSSDLFFRNSDDKNNSKSLSSSFVSLPIKKESNFINAGRNAFNNNTRVQLKDGKS